MDKEIYVQVCKPEFNPQNLHVGRWDDFFKLSLTSTMHGGPHTHTDIQTKYRINIKKKSRYLKMTINLVTEARNQRK